MLHHKTLKPFFQQAGVLDNEVHDAIDEVREAFGICTESGKPAPSYKISLTHVNEEFNMKV